MTHVHSNHWCVYSMYQNNICWSVCLYAPSPVMYDVCCVSVSVSVIYCLLQYNCVISSLYNVLHPQNRQILVKFHVRI